MIQSKRKTTRQPADDNPVAKRSKLGPALRTEEVPSPPLQARNILKKLQHLNYQATFHALTHDASSWVIYAPRVKTCSVSEFRNAWKKHPTQRRYMGKIFGRDTWEKRFSQTYACAPITFRYSGLDSVAASIPLDSPIPWLLGLSNYLYNHVSPGDTTVTSMIPSMYTNADIHRLTRSRSRSRNSNNTNSEELPYQVVLQNWYEKYHYIGAHADEIKQHVPGSPIFSLSWGGTRRFIIKPKPKFAHKGHQLELMLKSGDFVIMGGTLQHTHKHEIPPVRKTKDPPATRRISYTMRAFKPDYTTTTTPFVPVQ